MNVSHSYTQHALNGTVNTTVRHVLLQILTIKQQAVGVVKAFPYIPEQPRLVEVLADLQSEEPISNLTQNTGLDNAEYDAHWQQVVRYLEGVSADNLHLHVKLSAQ